MASSFFELSVISSGLFTTKGALNVVAHNISNAERKGYSRQVALTRARIPISSFNGAGMVGTGSELYGIGQIRNFYLDTKYWTNQGVLGEYSAKSTQNKLLQTILNETDDTGFNASINNLFSVINRDWATDPGNSTARLSVINTAQSLAQYFNTTYAGLQQQQTDINQEIRGMVSTINNLGLQIQNLNKQIYQSELHGDAANDLRDARALVVDELSKYVNVQVAEVELNKDLLTGKCEKRFQVSVNGYDFVNHFNLNTLNCVERTVKNNPEDVNGLYDIFWNNGVKFNSEFSLRTMSGELNGLLLTRDGNNQNYPTADIAAEISPGVPSIVSTANGGKKITFAVDSANRSDWPVPGSITIDGKIYAYDNFDCKYTYDDTTGKMVTQISIEIPPASGKMVVGNTVVSYSDLVIQSDGTITFKTDPPLPQSELNKKIKIGDMVFGGTATLVNPDGSVKIEGSSLQNDLNGITAPMSSSKIKVGSNVTYKGLPYFMSKLNTFVRGIAMSFNLGRDVNGNNLDGVTGHYLAFNQIEGDNTGYNFFTYTENNTATSGRSPIIPYHLITAGNFSVSKELLENPRALAASTDPAADISDASFILELTKLKHNPLIFNEGEYGNFIESIIGELGIISNEAISFESNYMDITSTIENQRLSVSSVSLDEEMSAMIFLQQIYNACAKMISTLDGIYDTTINMVK